MLALKGVANIDSDKFSSLTYVFSSHFLKSTLIIIYILLQPELHEQKLPY